MHSDQRYITALLDNDAKVIREIYELFAPGVKVFILANSGTVDDAKDIFQEGLIAICRYARRPGFILTCPFGGYLHLVCRGKWLNELKKRKRESVTINAFDGYFQQEPEEVFHLAQMALDTQDRHTLLEQKFAALGDRCQVLLKLSWSGLGMEEVAQRMEVTYGYARKKKSECIARLMSLIKGDKDFNLLKIQP